MPIQLTTDSEQSYRHKHRSCLAEFVGTFVLMLLGLAAAAQFTLNHSGTDAHMLVWGCWGLGLMVALYISAGISGGHLNPAVTVAMAMRNRFSWHKVPGYLMAQFLGALVAAIFVFMFYAAEINAKDPSHTLTGHNSTVNIFITNRAAGHSNFYEFFCESFASFVFILAIFAITSPTNEGRPTEGLTAFGIGVALTVIGATLSSPAGYALNPARDFAPRLFASFVYGWQIFTLNGFHFGVPLLGPIVGGVAAGWVSDLLLVY